MGAMLEPETAPRGTMLEPETAPRGTMLEPETAPRTGRLIVLNGASSSGKSTLAHALQDALDSPFLLVSSDQLIAAGLLPRRREPQGPFAWWEQMRPRFFEGFHRCLPALAAAGNDLIVEHVIEFATWRAELAELLDGFDVFLVGVHCDPDELDRREHMRGDRRPGEGRAHVEENRIHEFGPYDYETDTTDGVSPDLVARCLDAWRHRTDRALTPHHSPKTR
jgi:chloramphenicol 3-O phosphotransferase